jgi:hypothetical protein
MNDLRQMFTTSGLLADRNGDGVADGLSVSFQLPEEVPLVGIIDLMARLGLETSELNLPEINVSLSSSNGLFAIEVDGTVPEDTAYCRLDKEHRRINLFGGSQGSIDRLLRWLAAEWPHGVDSIQIDADLSNLEDPIEEILFSKKGVSFKAKSGASFFSAVRDQRDGQAPINRPKPLESLTDLWTTAGFYQAGRVDLTSGTDVAFTGISSPEQVVACARLAARIGLASTGIRFPLTGEIDQIPELTFEIREQSAFSEDTSVLKWDDHLDDSTARRLLLSGGSASIYNAIEYLAQSLPLAEGGSFGEWEAALRQEAEQVKSSEGYPVLWEGKWQDPGERLELEEGFADTLPKIEEYIRYLGDKGISSKEIAVAAFVSEPAEVRLGIENRWTSDLFNMFSETRVKVEVHSAFKTGLIWIKERIIPNVRSVDRKVGKVRISFQRENRQDGMELSHRWLQEIYPVDQLLEQEWGISLDQIEFDMNEDLPFTYQVTCWDSEDYEIGTWSLNVPVTSVPYLDGAKKSYPTNSQLQVWVDQQLLCDKAIETDRLRFWTYFQRECLQKLGDQISTSLIGTGSQRGTHIPLFYSMDVTVEMSEQEERLSMDEEAISSLEALHEDIYFYTLDYFADLGEKTVGVAWNAPGAVRPFMKRKDGISPKAHIIVREYIPNDLIRVRTKSLAFSPSTTEPIRAVVEVVEEGQIKEWVWNREGEKSSSNITEHRGLFIPDEWRTLADHPSVNLWEVARSFERRPIHAVELTAPAVSNYRSPHTMALYKPTILIETGHHANEVSSMPAIRDLAEEIVLHHSDWLHHVNIVVIPCANPDGRALHRQLTEDNPEWKHHAARFNAVGLEYTHHRFQKTLFGEATVVPQLFYRWLPDVMVDDHGIPSHEWTQPFAGYNSPPRFPVSYWVPVSLIYGIARELDREAYPNHGEVLDAVLSAIEQSIRNDERIWEKNLHYRDRYIRYGHKYEPEAFPLEEQGNLIFYRWPTKPASQSTALLARHPEWCTLDIISEAADETVLGEALEDCVQSHKLFDRAIIEWVASQTQPISRYTENGFIRIVRKRPLQISSMQQKN